MLAGRSTTTAIILDDSNMIASGAPGRRGQSLALSLARNLDCRRRRGTADFSAIIIHQLLITAERNDVIASRGCAFQYITNARLAAP